MVYTSTSRPLAVLEMLLHVTRDTVPSHLVLIPIEVEDGSIAEATGLPRDWNQLPYSARARRIGDEWARANRSLALLVPSVVLPSEKNLLINPLHPDLPGVWVLPPEAFQFDRRLLR